MRPSLLIFLLAIVAVIASATAKEVSITFLEDARAKCMDGSPAAYYLAANTSSTSWVIHLEGGGECASKTNCDARKGSALSSSKYFAASVKMNFLNQDTSYNPVLRQFNRVFLPYCSQDLWSGQRTAATNETFGYYFSGHLIVEAVLDELAKNHGLEHATEIVVTGVSPLSLKRAHSQRPERALTFPNLQDSAGGIGTWINVDYVASRFPSARVVAAPIAGFYCECSLENKARANPVITYTYRT